MERSSGKILKRLRIAQAEGKNLKSEVDRFLMIPHSTTGVAPAELLYGRMSCTKLPQLQKLSVDLEVRDRDGEQKEKGRIYADNKRNAVDSKIQTGDKVLMKQKKNKVSTTFRPELFTVIKTNGNQIVIWADSGVQYK